MPVSDNGISYALAAIESLSESIARLRSKPLSALPLDDPPTLRRTHDAALLALRHAYRAAHAHATRLRAATHAERDLTDRAELTHANYVYELTHYEREIRDHRDFRHAHTDAEINLSDLETFWSEAPAHITSSIDRNNPDPHELMLARLEFERLTRVELAEQVLTARRDLEKKEAKVDAKRAGLEVASMLKPLLDQLGVIQEKLGMKQLWDLRMTKLAELLPAPLYCLYGSLCAARDLHREAIEVSIVGDIPTAQTLAIQEAARIRREGSAKRPRLDMTGTGWTTFYAPHPLYVAVDLLDLERREVVLARIMFMYLPACHLMTAKTAQEHQVVYLRELFEGDDGGAAPSEAVARAGTSHSSSTNDANTTSLEGGYPTQRVDRPYGWCQKVAGLDFLPPLPYLPTHPDVYARGPLQEGLETYRQGSLLLRVLGLLRVRLVVQICLKKQTSPLAALVAGTPGFDGARVVRGWDEDLGVITALRYSEDPIAVDAAGRLADLLDQINGFVEVPFTEERISTRKAKRGGGAAATATAGEEDQDGEGRGRNTGGGGSDGGGVDTDVGEGDVEEGDVEDEEEEDDQQFALRRARVFAVNVKTGGSFQIHVAAGFPWEMPKVVISGIDEDTTRRLEQALVTIKETSAKVGQAKGKKIAGRGARTAIPDRNQDKDQEVGVSKEAKEAKEATSAAASVKVAVADLLGRSPGAAPEPGWHFAGRAVAVCVALATAVLVPRDGEEGAMEE